MYPGVNLWKSSLEWKRGHMYTGDAGSVFKNFNQMYSFQRLCAKQHILKVFLVYCVSNFLTLPGICA